MNNIFKRIFIPSGEETQLVAYKSWVVRWNSKRNNGFEYVQEAEIFTSEEDAHKFAEQLRDAFKLLRYRSGGWGDMDNRLTKVTTESNQNTLTSAQRYAR